MSADALYQDPKWLRYMEVTFSHVGYIVSRGGLLIVGAVLVWVGYISGISDGTERGFYDGCKATSVASTCDNAVTLGSQLRKQRAVLPMTAVDKEQVEKLCARMREELPEGMVLHYECSGRVP